MSFNCSELIAKSIDSQITCTLCIAFYPYEKTRKRGRTYIVSMTMALHKYQTAPLAEFGVKRSAEELENLYYAMKASGTSAYMKLRFEVVRVGHWMARQVLTGIDCMPAFGGMVAENVAEGDVGIVAEVCIAE